VGNGTECPPTLQLQLDTSYKDGISSSCADNDLRHVVSCRVHHEECGKPEHWTSFWRSFKNDGIERASCVIDLPAIASFIELAMVQQM
jgi:hypothetical protein